MITQGVKKAERTKSSIGGIAVPPVSEFSSQVAWEEAVWRNFALCLVGTKQSAEILSLLDVLITVPERRMLVRRIAAVDRIRAGKRYREIANELWLAPQTLTSIKRALADQTYRSYRERGKTERTKRVHSRSPRSKQKFDPSKRRVRTKFGTFYRNR